MTGKQKCAILKEIRRDIAAKNDIRLTIEECTHKGNCKGTCPRCEAEVRLLERELEKKRKAGARTVLAGVSAGLLAASLSGCSPVEKVKDMLHPPVQELEGDVAILEPESEPEQEEQPMLEGDPIAEEELVEATMGEPEVMAEEGEPEIEGLMPAPEEEEAT